MSLALTLTVTLKSQLMLPLTPESLLVHFAAGLFLLDLALTLNLALVLTLICNTPAIKTLNPSFSSSPNPNYSLKLTKPKLSSNPSPSPNLNPTPPYILLPIFPG